MDKAVEQKIVKIAIHGKFLHGNMLKLEPVLAGDLDEDTEVIPYEKIKELIEEYDEGALGYRTRVE